MTNSITPLLEEWVAEELSPLRLDLRAEQLADAEADGRPRQHELGQLRTRQRTAKARIDRLYQLMQDPDYPIDVAKAALAEEKARLARIEGDIAAARQSGVAIWTVDDYRSALSEGLGCIPGLLEVATADEKNALYNLLGLELTYTRNGPGSGILTGVIRPRLQQRGVVLRVGGGT